MNINSIHAYDSVKGRNNRLNEQRSQNATVPYAVRDNVNFGDGISKAEGILSRLKNADYLGMIGKLKQSIETAGFLVIFLIQDMIGMTIPRTITGFNRDREITGKLHIQEGFEVLGREGITDVIQQKNNDALEQIDIAYLISEINVCKIRTVIEGVIVNGDESIVKDYSVKHGGVGERRVVYVFNAAEGRLLKLGASVEGVACKPMHTLPQGDLVDLVINDLYKPAVNDEQLLACRLGHKIGIRENVVAQLPKPLTERDLGKSLAAVERALANGSGGVGKYRPCKHSALVEGVASDSRKTGTEVHRGESLTV